MLFFSLPIFLKREKSDTIIFVGVEVNFYRTKLFPYLESINSYFMKLISRYSSEKH